MKENILKDKSFLFAIRIINLGKFLNDNKKDFILSKQILRSGTSIGANIKESEYAESKADFIHKLHISLKESSETEYWLDLLYQTQYIDEKSYESIKNDLVEIIKLLISIIKKSKK